jgi:hypothetical protein
MMGPGESEKQIPFGNDKGKGGWLSSATMGGSNADSLRE